MHTTLITLNSDADLNAVQRELQGLGIWTTPMNDMAGSGRALTVAEHSVSVSRERLHRVAGVAEVLGAPSPHPLVDAQATRCQELMGMPLGQHTMLFAGPCSVESQSQIRAAAAMVARSGALLLRGGAFKPRTSPYAFAGHGREALIWLRKAADAWGLGVVTEAMSEEDTEAVAEVADMIQVGSRNMANYALLKRVGRTGRPVLLKRGAAATVDEWLLAGEHCLAAGASQVIFCERGVRGFDPSTRNLLDLGAAALLKHVHGQPVVVDPSHAVGRRDLIAPLCQAAAAIGVDGLLVEAHPEASGARSDGAQALSGAQLQALGQSLGLTTIKRQAGVVQ